MTKEINKNLPAYLEKMNAEILELNFQSLLLLMDNGVQIVNDNSYSCNRT